MPVMRFGLLKTLNDAVATRNDDDDGDDDERDISVSLSTGGTVRPASHADREHHAQVGNMHFCSFLSLVFLF
jgi:hypothetical protein